MKKNKYLDSLIEITYLGIIFLIPIYFGFVFPSANPFELQKLILFKILLGLLVFFSVFKVFLLRSNKDLMKALKRFFKKYYFIPSLLLAYFLLSLFWSANPAISWWGSLERQLGVSTWVSLGVFSVLLSFNLLRSEDLDKKIYRIFLSSSFSVAIVSLYAVLQWVGLDFLYWNEAAVITKRAFSSLGQANLLGSFIVLNIFIIPYLFKNNRNKYFRFFFIFNGGLQLAALWCSGSRGAYLGFLFSLLIFAFYYLRKKKIKSFLIPAFLLFFLALIFLFPRLNSAGGFKARINLWSASWVEALNNPWGQGLENQGESIIKHYQADWGTFNKVNVFFDRAHNFILDTLLVGGFIALVLVLAGLYFFYRLLFLNIRQGERSTLSLFLTLSLSSFFLSLLFSFSSFVSLLYLSFFFSLASVLNFRLKEKSSKLSEGALGFEHKIFLVVLAFVLIMSFFQEIKNLKTDYYFYAGSNYFYQGQTPTAILNFSYIRQNGLANREYYYKVVNLFFDNYEAVPDKASQFLLQEELRKIINVLEPEAERSFAEQFSRAQIFSILKEEEVSQDFFKRLLSQSPSYPLLYYRQAKAKVLANQKDLALLNYQTALSFLPEKTEVEGDINLKALKDFSDLILEEINNLDL